MRILVIEDELKTASYLRNGLIGERLRDDVSMKGDDGLHAALSGKYS